jgi:hypothetical protein
MSDRCREQVIRFNKLGIANRAGVPDGWAGRKKEAGEVRARAKIEAKKAVQMMIAEGLVEKPEDPRVEQALEVNVEIMLARSETDGQPVYEARERISASRVILDFLKARPASRIDARVTKAEDFLAILAGHTPAEE